MIHVNESSVEVLGTAFNVRSIAEDTNVQVAVVEGRVAFRSGYGSPDKEELSVILTKGQYGYMDIYERSILVDDLAVENYLAWKDGRLVFDGLTLSQVCIQLNRIYGTQCSFESNEVSRMQLTSNFANDSIEKTLEIVAMSLNIEYQTDGQKVFWAE